MCEILKAFAGPVATIIASITAAGLTWYFTSRQVQIAKQQAETALGQLRYNLFEKQYTIYKSAIELIKLIENEAYKDEFNPNDIVTYLTTLDEARFFFRDDICNFLCLLQERCQYLAAAYEDLKHIKNGAERASRGKEIVDQTTQLRELRLQMPTRFEKALQFPQLTGRAP
jgi:hypothetical protein